MIQGGILSPTIFILVINDLLQQLELNNNIPMAFADDLAAIQESVNKTREALIIIKNWNEENDFELNQKKSGVIIHERNNKKSKYYIKINDK